VGQSLKQGSTADFGVGKNGRGTGSDFLGGGFKRPWLRFHALRKSKKHADFN
jgi:hypothetical protein